ncbi:hypothetical protein SH668x_002155 [Planctomicrobium sp. SH668]|uniref:hypothetical protein n=1 Tax=Planctomicrobium sp. SH668 TaxID=3448126 RepID=UPI003F5C0218
MKLVEPVRRVKAPRVELPAFIEWEALLEGDEKAEDANPNRGRSEANATASEPNGTLESTELNAASPDTSGDATPPGGLDGHI